MKRALPYAGIGVICYSFTQTGEKISAMRYCREIDVVREKHMKNSQHLSDRYRAMLYRMITQDHIKL